MRRYIMKIVGTLTLACMLTTVAIAKEEDKKEDPKFPKGVAVTELSAKQQVEAQKLLDEAIKTYGLILGDENKGKQEYLQSNLAFVTQRLVKMNKELNEKKGALAGLDKEVMEKEKMIARMSVSDAAKQKKKVQLVREFDNRKETLEFRIAMIGKHVGNLEKRQNALKAEMKDLAIEPKGSDLTAAEKAQMRLEDHRRKQQLDRFKKYE